MKAKFDQQAIDYQRIEKAIQFVGDNFYYQPELEEIARHIGMSEFHFQRLFKRWVGISPKRFLQYVTKEYAKQLLDRSENLLNVSFQSGLSGSGRLHDLFVTCEAMTPGESRAQGAGLNIDYAYHATPFGECLLALTQKGICGFYFIPAGRREYYLSVLHRTWPNARFFYNTEEKHVFPLDICHLANYYMVRIHVRMRTNSMSFK